VVVGFGLAVVGIPLALFGQLAVTAPVWQVVAVTMVLGLGMGNTMAPATDSIMGSLPREKAGVGSAMNDTTRQTGGAVGVAVLGSILASRYRSSVVKAAAAQHLPAQVTKAIRGDVGSAVSFAHSGQAGPLAGAVTAIARQGFVTAYHDAVRIGALIMLAAAVAVVRWLPARALGEEPSVAPMPAPITPGIGEPAAVTPDVGEPGVPVLEPALDV
jgi:hypothetical protein